MLQLAPKALSQLRDRRIWSLTPETLGSKVRLQRLDLLYFEQILRTDDVASRFGIRPFSHHRRSLSNHPLIPLMATPSLENQLKPNPNTISSDLPNEPDPLTGNNKKKLTKDQVKARRNMNTLLKNETVEDRTFAPLVAERAPPTVAELVLAAQKGDRDAFGELFERYRDGIFAIAMRRVRNADEAEELTQDVFIQAMQKIGQLRVPEAFGGWLRQIVHRMAINRMTRRNTALPVEPETLEATCVAEGTPDLVAEDREQAETIRECVAKLGQMDQQTLIAFYLQSKSLVEMSDQFDAPIGTIKRRLHVARKRLAKEMSWVQAV